MTDERFVLYVKAASNGKDVGDCPFSQRALLFCRLKVPSNQVEISPVDTSNKPQEFLQLNPEGKVPVLVDRGADNKIIADSGEITKYIDSIYPEGDFQINYNGPALVACSGVFPKLAALLKNKSPDNSEELKGALLAELSRVDAYLKSEAHEGMFLIGDKLNEIDCMFLPRLRHVVVGGGHYAGIKIPDKMDALHKYFDHANKNELFMSTCCPEEEIIYGWSKHAS